MNQVHVWFYTVPLQWTACLSMLHPVGTSFLTCHMIRHLALPLRSYKPDIRLTPQLSMIFIHQKSLQVLLQFLWIVAGYQLVEFCILFHGDVEYATITKIRTALDFHNILFIFSCVDFWFSALFLGILELLLLRSRDNNWFTWSPWLGSWLLHLLYLSVVIFRHSFHVFVLYSSLVNHLAGMVKYNMVQWHVTSFSDLQILNQISDANG